MEVIINDRIRVRTVTYFNSFNMTLKHDSVASTFHFDYFFDPLNPDQAETACVSHFHEATIKHLGETLITGYILSQEFSVGAVKMLAKFAGYSKAGVLEDCQIPPSSYPLQMDGLTLRQIATRLLRPFKLTFSVDPAVAKKIDIAYPVTTAKESQTIKQYLTELATQRDIIISHDNQGNVLFTRSTEKKKPLFHVEKGVIVTAMSLIFSGQPLHSQITAMKQVDPDKEESAGEHTVINPFVPIVFRPKVIVQSSGDDNSTKDVAENALASELRNIKLMLKIDRWDVDGIIIRPNIIISVYAPDLYIYKKTNFFVESVDYIGNSKETTCTLTCVLPCVYDGSKPENIFVYKHENSGIRSAAR